MKSETSYREVSQLLGTLLLIVCELAMLCYVRSMVTGHSEARYRSLAESYALLSHDHERLKMQYLGMVETHEDVLGQLKLLKKTVLVLQELVRTFTISSFYLFLHVKTVFDLQLVF